VGRKEILMYRLILCAVALIQFALLSSASSAQGRSDRDFGGPGTYTDTCTDAHWDGSILYARCQRMDGGWRNSSIDSRNCRAQILNLDGYLSCGQATSGYQQGPYDNHDSGRPGGPFQGGWRGGLPPGDYKLTCQDMHVAGNRLYATCQRRNGSWHGTSLYFDRCSSPIVNNDGNLRCTRF